MEIDLPVITAFQDYAVPGDSRLAGWAALVQALAIDAPVRRPSCVSDRHVRGSRREEGGWQVFDKRYWPGEDLADHLSFAIRHEDFDPLILKRAFDAVVPVKMKKLVEAPPTGAPARRLWFLYESMSGRTLDLPDAPNVAAI